MPESLPARPAETPLESWKEIAAYLQKDITTARRWEKREGLPVHRHSHEIRSSVYAYPAEIDRWRAARRAVPEIIPAPPIWRRLVTPAFAVTLMLCLVMVGNGLRPQVAFADQAGQVRTMLCSGPECDGRISPDGKSLSIRVNGGLGIRELAANKVRTLVAPEEGTYVSKGVFSPDGSRIAYARRPEGRFDAQRAAAEETIILNVNGTGARTVFRGGSPLAWSPDGKRLLLRQSGDPAYVASLVWVSVADSSTQKLPITHPNLDVAIVSPDGRYIAYNASKSGEDEENVYIAGSDGLRETLVSASPSYQEPVAWTPDAKRLVFGQFEESHATFWTAGVANGGFQGPAVNTHVVFEKGALFVGVARSGALYYRLLTSVSDVFTAAMDAGSGKVTGPPVAVPVSRAGNNVLPRWASSRQLFVLWAQRATESSLPADIRELSLYSFETGRTERVATQAKFATGAYCGSKDGASLLYNERAQPVRLALGTGQVAPLFPGAAPFIVRSCSDDLVAAFDASGIKVRNLQDGTEKEVYRFSGNQGTVLPLLSHDGRSIAFILPEKGACAPHRSRHGRTCAGSCVRELARGTPAPVGSGLVAG